MDVFRQYLRQSIIFAIQSPLCLIPPKPPGWCSIEPQ